MVQIPTNATSGPIIVTTCTASAASASYTVNSKPTTPDNWITSSATVCQGQTGVVYEAGVSLNSPVSYDWTYSGTGATFTANTATPLNTFDFGTNATSGTISVVGVNSCGSSVVARQIAVTVNPLPGQPAVFVSETSPVCVGSAVNFTAGSSSNATSYNWTATGFGGSAPTFANPTAGTTNSIDFTGTTGSGTITVYGINACGNSVLDRSTGAISVTPSVPGTPGVFTVAPATVCQGATDVVFTAGAAADATSYIWVSTIGGGGATFDVNPTVTPTTDVTFSGTATSGNIEIYGTNVCGNSASPAITAVTVQVAPTITTQPVALKLCENSSGSFTVATSTGSPSYQWFYSTTGSGGPWTITDAVPGLSGHTTSQLDITSVPLGYNGAYVRCIVTAAGCPTISNSALLTVVALPAGGSIPTIDFCAINNSATVTVNGVTNVTQYAWALPSGLTGTSSTNSIVVSSATPAVYTVTVTPENVDGALTCAHPTPINGTVNVLAAPGDPAVFGSSTWNIYTYLGANRDNLGAVTYAGYYTQNLGGQQGFNTQAAWANTVSPDDAGTWQGCIVPDDNFTFVHKRQGFTPGYYTLQVDNWDDASILYVNGSPVWSAPFWSGDVAGNGFAAPFVIAQCYYLDASSTIEFRTAEGGGGANAQLTITVRSGVSGVATPVNPVCDNNTGQVNLAPSGGGGSYSYLWSTGATIQNISGLAIGSYSVTITDANCIDLTASASASVTSNWRTNAGTDAAICDGTSTTFAGAVVGTLPTAPSGTNNASQAIPDNNATGISKAVTLTNTGCVLNANNVTNITIALTHTYNSDVKIYLTPPGGTEVPLITGKGGNGDNMNVTLQTGGAALPTGNSTINGAFAPETPFASFPATTAYGTWTLRIFDNVNNDVGNFTSWGISFAGKCDATYSWTGPGGYTSTAATTAPPVTTAGTYALGISAGGCTSTDQVVLTVNPSPALDGVTVSDPCWITDDAHTYTITARATGDSPTAFDGSTYGMLTLVNLQGARSPNYGGYYAWNISKAALDGAGYTKNQMAINEGWIGMEAVTYGPNTATLVGGSTSVSGNQRTVNWDVRPNTTFH